ncbi:MAG: hypothetical protein NZ902_04020 [Acidilobaceae archaeon]|nr:hypothetical protein [Acidilobaceae archaeon]MCX8165103.1 hypothetical protein [Acidilobaceae archaeon]
MTRTIIRAEIVGVELGERQVGTCGRSTAALSTSKRAFWGEREKLSMIPLPEPP